MVLEPSCAATFRSDLPELLAGDEDAHRLAGQVVTLAELLAQRVPGWCPRTRLDRRAIAQPHCHQHAIMGTGPDQQVMESAGIDVEILDAGCCGLAGNFGFEDGHYDVSMACAEDKLLPILRATDPETLVIADGYSCRTQIEQSDVDRTPVHLAEVLAAGVRGHPLGAHPDAELAQRPSRPTGTGTRAAVAAGVTAALVTGLAVAGGGAVTAGGGVRRRIRRA